MSDRLLNLYHRLPAPMRSGAASLRGLRLRAWRYGPETERLVSEALERDNWSAADWESYQGDRLSRVLHRAATRVPYYREQWARRRRNGDRASWEYLENWPVLEKEDLRRDAQSFVADDCDRSRMFHVHTSGTTGKPLDMWHCKATARSWYALFEARCRRWNGLSRNDRWAILGGQLITPVATRRPPFWVWNMALNQLYMSSYHLASDLIANYADALKRYQIRYLYGYTSALYELALHMIEADRRDIEMSVVLTNAEPVFDYQRRAIEEAFHCPVIETYGMAEMAAGASACSGGAMHLWPEVARLETIQHTEGSASSELVSTGLLNPDMPLIRYRVGDRVSLSNAQHACECGRGLPVLESIEGRSDDILYTSDGRRIGRLDPVFKVDLPVKEAQIVQEALDVVRVRYVPASGFTRASGLSIVERLQARMGDVRVILEEVESLPRGANGKFRAVICNLAAEPGEGQKR